MSPALRRLVRALSLLAVTTSFSAAQEAAGAWILGEIEVETQDVYPPRERDRSRLERLVNGVHWTTRESVVRREMWIRSGERITEEDVAELERNLRATGLFAEVTAELRPSDDPAHRDLFVRTRDRLSLGGGPSGSLVGAVRSLGGSLSEANFLGTGDDAAFSFERNTDQEFRGRFSYRDRHVLGTWASGSAQVGRTEEGDFYSLGLQRPFRYLADERAWSARVWTVEHAADYYADGETVAEVPLDVDSFELTRSWRDGAPDRFRTLGLRLRHQSRDYSPATGEQADEIRVPGDTTHTFGGVSWQLERILGFREVDRLDTLGFVQDIRTGFSTSFEVGATSRDEDGVGRRLEPTASTALRMGLAPGERTLLAADLTGEVRSAGGDAQGYSLGGSVRAFHFGFDAHTLAARAAFEQGAEHEDLPLQLMLSEEEGLRGYPHRELLSDRIAWLNLEDRIDLDARLGSFELGAVAFVDVGWVGELGDGFGHPWRSFGVGLRVGSDELLGVNVVRIDLAIPLDGEFDPLLSIALGQVFGF